MMNTLLLTVDIPSTQDDAHDDQILTDEHIVTSGPPTNHAEASATSIPAGCY